MPPVSGSLIGLGAACLLSGPGIWALRATIIRQTGYAFAPPWALAGLPFAGLALLLMGWVLVGAGLQPGGRPELGALLALGLYFAVGLIWAFVFNLRLGAPVLSLFHPAILLIALIWPMQILQALEWLGFSFV